MTSESDTHDHLTLGAAAKHAPGKPSANAMWRWCRRGVLARNGERVRLQHVRAGGKIFTTAGWVGEFCRRLADSDRVYFDQKDAAAQALPPRDGKFGPPARKASSRKSAPVWRSHEEDARLERELSEEGL